MDRVRDAAGPTRVVWEPELLPEPRYPSDHVGAPLERSAADEARWRAHLAAATILFDFDATHRHDLPDLAPRVRWIQATSAGIGRFVHRHRYAERMPGTVFTTASGVHARPLAEFALLALLGHVRRLPRMVAARGRREWRRFAGTDLEGRTAVVVGYGAIGREIGRRARAMGVRVIGVKRTPCDAAPGDLHADEVHGADRLPELLPRADFLVLAAPDTPATEGMIGARELAALPPGAALVNVGRGSLVDEAALVDAVRSEHLGSAWLDVFAEEPLPPQSPLWTLDNVVVSPHSASTSDRENERIVELFCENLRRDREGRPLLNVLDPERMY